MPDASASGIADGILRWVELYLRDRKQNVVVGSEMILQNGSAGKISVAGTLTSRLHTASVHL